MKFEWSRKTRVQLLFGVVCFTLAFTTIFMALDSYNQEEAVVMIGYDDTDYESFRGVGDPIFMEHHHKHDDTDESIAVELTKRVKVLCWIMTSPSNLAKKATAVKKTWAKRCNKFIFFSSVTNTSFPTIGLNVSEGREHLTGKTVNAFRHCYKHYGNQYDWFLKADDDTYVIVENLRFFLSHHNPESAVYFGFKFKTIVKEGYFSGGAGYVLSRKALEIFVLRGLRNPLLCRQDGGAEDAEIGRCMAKLNVKAGESLDIYNRETFHPFVPIAHLEGHHPDWFFKYSAHVPQKGIGCCSDYSISFHYMSPSDIYLMDYLLYHLRPYGIVHGVSKEKFLPHEKSYVKPKR